MAKSSGVVLVHGAWADGSSWAKVIPLLTAKGHPVTAVQIPLTSLGDDVATVKRAIAHLSGPIILVGHSYGGAVITAAGSDPRVEALVYIAAFAPDAGESAGSLGAGVEPPPLGAEVRPDAEGYLKLTRSGVSNAWSIASSRSTLPVIQDMAIKPGGPVREPFEPLGGAPNGGNMCCGGTRIRIRFPLEVECQGG